jgi:hypothetical protein
MKRVLLAGFVLACVAAAPAGAQSPEVIAEMQARLNAPSDPNLPPVEGLSCDQMMAEMSVAGQQMNSQMDPNFAANVQEMQDESQRRMRGAQAGMMGAGIVCAVPGLNLACGAAMNAQVASQMAHADEDQARMDTIIGSVNDSMQGIDVQRMQAINARFESQHCPMPEAPPQQ